jgi:transposase-like protein
MFVNTEEGQDNVNDFARAWSVPPHALENFRQTAKECAGLFF